MSKNFPSTFTSKDNLKIKCSASVPAENPKAILIVVHGMGEHSQSLPFLSLENFFAGNLLLETNRDEVHSDILHWLNGRLGNL